MRDLLCYNDDGTLRVDIDSYAFFAICGVAYLIIIVPFHQYIENK